MGRQHRSGGSGSRYWGNRLPLVLLIAGLVILVSMSLSVVLSLLFPNGATAKALLQVLIIAMTF
ncbi:hypothetical protein [Paenibacillus chitinolyticus]|uniref:hypothetical protein n=1 Tax=Paenibacillus chitinolyticus TaxID=79263 RepID=UPI00210D46B6|nr:hypothetical protein [Paenibacillus chitinolyticus]